MAIVDLRLNPSARELRWFGLLLLLFLGAIGALVEWRTEWRETALGIAGAGVVLCAVFYALPPLRLPIYRGWIRLFYPIGWVISHLVLGAAYYLVLTPIGVVARLLGYNPMRRGFERDRTSYWVRHESSQRPERYFQQS